MNLSLAFQEEAAQDYEPQLSGWAKKEREPDSLSALPISNWERAGIVRYPIWDVSSASMDATTVRLVTQRPIQVEVRRGEELILAENSNLHIFATGNTEEEAVQDFCVQLVCQYEHYLSVPNDQLIGEALHLKGVFENLFTVE